MRPAIARIARAIMPSFPALMLAGCATMPMAMEPGESEWRAGHAAEAAGDSRSALNSYLVASTRGLKIAQYDAGRLMVALDGEPARQREGLELLSGCANTESAGFYFVKKDSEAAKFAALAELASLFENGRVVPRDTQVAGYLYDRAQDVERNLGGWFSSNRSNPAARSVFAARKNAAEGYSRMEKLGYAGERFEWSEINSLLTTDSGVSGKAKGRLRYKIASSSFDPSSETAIYEYEITDGEYNLETDRIIVREMCRKIKNEFCDRHPELDPADVYASPKSYATTGNRVTYEVSVFWLKPTELEYSARTRTGILAIRTDGRNLADAEAWARKNIETLAASQNAVLSVGERPPSGARYKILDTELVDSGTRLKIKFQTID